MSLFVLILSAVGWRNVGSKLTSSVLVCLFVSVKCQMCWLQKVRFIFCLSFWTSATFQPKPNWRESKDVIGRTDESLPRWRFEKNTTWFPWKRFSVTGQLVCRVDTTANVWPHLNSWSFQSREQDSVIELNVQAVLNFSVHWMSV